MFPPKQNSDNQVNTLMNTFLQLLSVWQAIHLEK